jgi:solute carrier family 35 protein E3
LLSALLLETHGPNSVFEHDFEKAEFVIVLLTGLVSVSVNVCAFGLIGKTSAVTYQVVGHCKTILIFVFGLLMFPAREGETAAQFWKKIIGLIISMSGMVLYTYFERKEKAKVPEPIKGDCEQLLPANGAKQTP